MGISCYLRSWLGIIFGFTWLNVSAEGIEPAHSGSTVCPKTLDRPCVALVLGGGGARGGAHIGVLKALEEEGVSLDLIVGTSIGAFVGGLYASGKSASEVGDLFFTADWNQGYRDALSRSDIPMRRKRQLDTFPVQLDLGFNGRAIKLPKGAIQGQGMKALVDGLVGHYAEFESFDQLPVPFRAVAAEVGTGEEVVLDRGDFATALQTSMSLPGILRPIEHNGRMLVDGGIANNLPVSVAKDLGADIVIAVDIGSPQLEEDQLDSGIVILRQLTSMLTQINVDYQRSLLQPTDLLIHPAIEGVNITSFDKMDEAMADGYRETRKQFIANPDFLTHFSANPRLPHTVAEPEELFLDEVRIDRISLENKTRLGDHYLLHRMGIKENVSYSIDDIRKGINRLYGQGTIARTTTSWVKEETENRMNIFVEEKEWGPGYLNFKLAFEDDFDTFSHYQIGASFRLTNLSEYGAEWYTTFEFGTEKKILTELYWPIKNSGFFASTQALTDRDVYDLVADGESLGNIITNERSYELGLGWDDIDQLEITSRAVRRHSTVEVSLIAETILLEVLGVPVEEIDVDRTGVLLDVQYDRLDHNAFPKSGWKLDAEILRTQDRVIGRNQGYTTQIDTEVNGVISWGSRHSFRGLMRYQSADSEDVIGFIGTQSLGGFLNLSGTSKDSVVGREVRFSSVVYTHEVKENNFGAITLPLYVGASLEAGNAWPSEDAVDYDDLIHSASAFLGWDSPLGPMYFAYGKSDNDRSSVYFFLGVTF